MFKKKTRFYLLAFVLVLALIGLMGCQSAAPDDDDDDDDDGDPEISELVFATGPAGGSWYPVGAAMGEFWRTELGLIVHVEQGGGEANIRGVNAGNYDLGFSQSMAAFNASNALGPFKGDPHTNFLGLAVLYPNVQQQVVWADSDIYTIDDMKGKAISPGPLGFTGETIASLILEQHSLTYADMAKTEHVGYSDAIALLRDRHIDVFWPSTLVPAPSITEASVMGPGVRIVPLSDATVAALEALNPGLLRHIIPANSYRGQTEDVQTIQTPTIVIVRSDLPEELVYQLTKSLVENRDALIAVSSALEDFTAETAPLGMGVDLHPGAMRYYKEIGVQ